MKFDYDAFGHRIAKHIHKASDNARISSTYYVRDAQGNIMATYEQKLVSNNVSFLLMERHIYGSSRIAIDADQKEMMQIGFGQGQTPIYINRKYYELSNHLGNVISVVSDVKYPVGILGGNIQSFKANIVSYNDYLPFGSTMTGRTFSSEKYRFGFNGQEKSDEISGTGNHTTAEFWEYEPRLGRRWNLDPKPQISISDYACFANNPIWFNDVLGNTWDPSNKSEETAKKLKTEFGKNEIKNKKNYSKYYSLLEKAENDGNASKISKYSRLAENASAGAADMKRAQSELDAMGADKTITFSLNDLKNSSMDGVSLLEWSGDWGSDNKSGAKPRGITINYSSATASGAFSYGNLAHESKHAYQVLAGLQTPNTLGDKYSFNQKSQYQHERDAYARQYFTSPTSMQIQVSDFRDITRTYMETLRDRNQEQVYKFKDTDIGIKTPDSPY